MQTMHCYVCSALVNYLRNAVVEVGEILFDVQLLRCLHCNYVLLGFDGTVGTLVMKG